MGNIDDYLSENILSTSRILIFGVSINGRLTYNVLLPLLYETIFHTNASNTNIELGFM